MNIIFWLFQLVLLDAHVSEGSNIDIYERVEKIIKSSFNNVSLSFTEGSPNDHYDRNGFSHGMEIMNHGRNKPNTEALKLSCIWESMKLANSRIQSEFPDAKGAYGPLIVPIKRRLCRLLSKTSCRSNIMETLDCNATYPYRSIDGTCNNLYNERWGSAPQPTERYLQADYGDGVSTPRMGKGPKGNKPLPNPRDVSNMMANATQGQTPKASVMFMQWGQFLNHDITLTAEQPTEGECCPGSKFENSAPYPCMPINVTHDPYFSQHGAECVRFVRTLPANRGCDFDEMQQQNLNTAFVDASNVYGSNDTIANYVRTKSGGRLNITNNDSTGKPMPPFGGTDFTSAGAPTCPFPLESQGPKCFLAGDIRIDMVPGLIVMHTAFLRLHNIIADELCTVNPHWTDDETIYQETRRIVGALAQQITYRDWLPILFGPKLMTKYGLNVGSHGYSDTYNEYVNPAIRNVFSAAAYRFGHSLAGDILKAGVAENDFPQKGHFFNTDVLQNDTINPSSMLKGMARCPMEPVDTIVGSALRNEMFNSPAGFDLVSINLMRGRDHGIPAYTKWRKFCGLKQVTNLKHLRRVMNSKTANEFNKLYKGKINEIDLYAAGLAENPIDGGLLGPTFSCIIARQFAQLKHGDRFWYESKDQPKPFTPEQLSAIRQTSIASILCKVTEGSNYSFQENPLLTTDVLGNDVQPCSHYHFLDLSSWKEETSSRKKSLNY